MLYICSNDHSNVSVACYKIQAFNTELNLIHGMIRTNDQTYVAHPKRNFLTIL